MALFREQSPEIGNWLQINPEIRKPKESHPWGTEFRTHVELCSIES